jgi:hypothetical protein
VAQLPKTEVQGAQQTRRFKKWQNLCPPQTRFLSSAVENRLVPKLEALGFQRVDVVLQQADWPVRGSQIELERTHQEIIDSVAFNFEKYKTPRVQVHFSRREIVPPHTFIRSANLVARPTQYYHLWGKPWWLLTRWWSNHASTRTIDKIESLFGQLAQFLESGEIGPNISRRVVTSGLATSADNPKSIDIINITVRIFGVLACFLGLVFLLTASIARSDRIAYGLIGMLSAATGVAVWVAGPITVAKIHSLRMRSGANAGE